MLRLASILAASAVFVFSAAYPSTHQLAGCDRTPPEERNGIYYDADGLIVHRPTAEHPCGDGGDTAQREGWYWLGVWIRQNTPGLPAFVPDRRLTFQEVLALLEPNRDGVFYRHPKLSPWNNPHSKEFGFSRDQMVPLIAAMGVWGMRVEVRRLWDALPEDALGKHTFNGNWRNLLGQDGQNCSEIKKRGCDATRDCPLKVDTRDCSLKVDTRSCPLQEDTRSCNTCIVSNPFGGCILYGNDPACEIAKAAQNVIYKANKDACEAAKAAQNVIYAGDKAACESAKATQNAIYKAEKDACEVAKAGEKLACEAQKTIDLNVCRLNNVHSGDFVGPATENLFSRALGEGLWHSLGEEELLANALLRVGLASRNRDDTGDDLNLIVMMLMSELRSPTDTSRAAIASYASLRPYSFGSYLGTYRSIYGQDATAMDVRIADGIRSGWRPDAPAVNGAVRWYHRIETGGLPGLADLYEPIIDRFIYGDVTATFSTQPPSNLPPTVDAVSPAVGSVEGGTKLVVTGRNLRTGTTVLVGGVVAEDVVVLNSSTLTAMTPPHESGIVDVSVTVPWPGGGTASLLSAFKYSADENGIPTPAVNPNIADILFRNTQTGDVAGWLMNGLALSQGGIIYSGLPLAWRIEGVGDLNGDGKSDIVFRNTQTGDVAAWLMDGLTLSQGVIVYSGLPLTWDIQAVGDLNADGKADLVFRNTQTGDVAGWLMDGVRLAQGAVIYSGLPAAWQIATSGDLNGDGKLDLVFRNTQTHDVAGWLMNGLALAQGAIIYSNLPTAWQIATAGDLDGDRKADLVFRNTQSGDVAGWLMSGLALTQGEVIYVGLPAAWHIMGMGDLNGDGRADLVFRQAQTGDVAGWTMNGLALTQGVIFYSGLPVAWQFEGIGDLDKR